ncbi:MAG: Gx transporter family protein [Clostridiales bacterium]|nr:Gx transporter family protein [Clostridiales bacterium]
MKSSKKIAYLGLCTTIALVLAYVESLIPPIFSAVPGIKMGLPNVVIIFVLYKFKPRDAIIVSLLRVFIVTLLFGNVMTLSYSLSGAVLSLTGMIILKKLDFLSMVGVSVVGAVLHNAGQIIMAMILLSTAEIGYYLIVLAITGAISGVLIGLIGGILAKRVGIGREET